MSNNKPHMQSEKKVHPLALVGDSLKFVNEFDKQLDEAKDRNETRATRWYPATVDPRIVSRHYSKQRYAVHVDNDNGNFECGHITLMW